MPKFEDQCERTIYLKKVPQRIISLVPSQTELIAYLGVINKLVGRTKFCIHPSPQITAVPVVGGTKKLHIDRIISLQPDLIIANKEENDREQVLQLTEVCPVWISDIANLPQATDMIVRIGKMLDVPTTASRLVREIERNFRDIDRGTAKKCLYFIWRDPWMVAGSETFISSMLPYAGLSNAMARDRYPVVSSEDMILLNPEAILLSSEPYPFKEKHIREIREILPNAEIKLVDGEYFSWYGSRLKDAAIYFNDL